MSSGAPSFSGEEDMVSWIWEVIRRVLRFLAGCRTGTLSINPASGPSGTDVTVTLTGLRAGDPITVRIPPGTTGGSADGQGNYTYTIRVFGEPGAVPITAITGQGVCEDTLRGTFTITP
jgi:hypothetical protein